VYVSIGKPEKKIQFGIRSSSVDNIKRDHWAVRCNGINSLICSRMGSNGGIL
jgi:hypothetical protein